MLLLLRFYFVFACLLLLSFFKCIIGGDTGLVGAYFLPFSFLPICPDHEIVIITALQK